MIKLWRLVSVVLLMSMFVSPLLVRSVSAATTQGGPIMLMGIDAEDTCDGSCDHGENTIYQGLVRHVLSNVTNGATGGILVIGAGKDTVAPKDDVTVFWETLATGLGEPVTFVNGYLNIRNRSFAGFEMLAVVSDYRNSPSGGLRPDENHELYLRRAQIASFVNSGGGLFGLAASGFGSASYGYLGGIGSFSFQHVDYNDVKPTTEGLALGITNTNLDVNAWHEVYTTFPSYLKVLARNESSSQKRAAVIGGAKVFISDIQLTPATASGAVGTKHTVTATIIENGLPVQGKFVTFTVTSGPHAGTTQNNKSTNQNGKVSFEYTGTSAGTDTIVASYVDSAGKTATSNEATMEWLNRSPLVNSGADVSGNEGAAIALNGSATDADGDTLSIAWTYTAVSVVDADATCSFADATAAATSITCTDDGVYNATLTVNDGINPAVSDTAVVTVGNVAPNADFRASAPVSEGSPITLELSNLSDVSSVDAGILTIAYDCDDGAGYQPSTSLSFTCNTADNGTRTVKARVSDDDGGSVTLQAEATIDNVAPTATFDPGASVNEGSPINVALRSPYDPSSVDTASGFHYSFACDGLEISLAAFYADAGLTSNVSCPTTDNGSRTLKARIFDKDEGSTLYTATWTVNNVAPTADFGASSLAVDEGDAFTISLTSPSDPSSADTAEGFTYELDCDDGLGFQTSTGGSVTCPTTDDGSREVQGKISDKDGGSTVYPLTVTVANVAPAAVHAAPTTPVNEGDAFTISLTSPSDPSSADTAEGFTYELDCDDSLGYQVSVSGSLSCPTFDNGTRNVAFKISDKDGGYTEYFATVTVANVAPTATLTNDGPVNEGSSFTITLSNPFDPSTLDAARLTFALDCGDGSGYQASTTGSATCSTVDSGTRNVKGKITDKDGGSNEYNGTVTIANIAPTADFVVPSAAVNEGTSFTLSLDNAADVSSVDQVTGFTYRFDCGSGYGALGSSNTATCSTNDNGTPTVKGEVRDKDGGVREYVGSASVLNVAPTITSITASATQFLTGSTNSGATFTGTATDPSSVDTAAGFSWMWAINGGTYTPGPNPYSATFTSCGTYSISGIATDKDGGASAPFTSPDTVGVYTAKFLAPLNEGMLNTVQKGRVVPVKISVGCGTALTGLTPAIQLLKGDQTAATETTTDNVETLSSSAADTTGVMRPVDGGYIYNLQVPGDSTVTAGTKFTIRVRPFGNTNTAASMYIVLEIRK